MKFLVDSDYVAEYLKGRDDTVRLLNSLFPKGMSVSLINFAEVYKGIYYGYNPKHYTMIFRRFLAGVDILPLNFFLDVIALSMLIGNWLGSLQLTWLIAPFALLLFVWGLFNVNNPIAIILSLVFGGVWGLIASHYETWQPIPILALVAVLTCLHFFLFRKHVKQGMFTLV